jgi:xylulokinase
MTRLLAIDVGTTNWKAALFSETGDLAGRCEVPAVTHRDSSGQFYDPGEMWAGIAKAVRGLPEGGRSPAAVCVTSMAEAGVPIGSDGNPVYPAITWFDPRSLPQAKELERRVGAKRLFEITGLDPNPIFSLPKIAWIRDNEPDVFSRIRHWLSVADYINYRLCGEIVTDYSLASRTLAFDLSSRGWSGEILEALDVPDRLFAPVRKAGLRIGSVRSEASRETGIAEGTPVILGGHDHHCAFLAAGALLNDVVLDSSGTAESVMTLLPPGKDRPKIFKGMRVGYFIDPDRFASMGGILASGASVDWAIENIWRGPGTGKTENGLAEYEKVIAAAAEAAPGCGGLFFLPHLRGAGAPAWEPRSRGAFVGLRTTHTRSDLMRAVFEGLSFELRVLLDAVEYAFDIKTTGMNTVGGGAKNNFWQTIKADITGLTVNVPDVKDSTAQGAALVAGVGAGVYPDLVSASRRTFRLLQRSEPRPDLRAFFTERYSLYRKIYGQLREINIALAELS